MRAAEACFKGQICRFLYPSPAVAVVIDRAGHNPSQREEKGSERRLLTFKGKLSKPLELYKERCPFLESS